MIMESITFIEFIEEEAIQTCGLSVYLAVRQKRYAEARDALDTLEYTLLPHLRLVNQVLGPLAPYSYGSFMDYVSATQVMCNTYRAVLFTTP
jgi:hypothetical protein